MGTGVILTKLPVNSATLGDYDYGIAGSQLANLQGIASDAFGPVPQLAPVSRAFAGAQALGAAGLAPDSDGDGVPDSTDNATYVFNPDQRDTDHDGYGNVVDADFDNNGAVNIADLAYFKAHFGTADPNADLNGDGRVNIADLAMFKSLYGLPPGPSYFNPQVIWQNGTAGVTIGASAARTTFNVGTNASTPTGVVWTGAVPTNNDNWSVPDNWLLIATPQPTDKVIFNATDNQGTSRIDPAFQGVIAGMADTGQAKHTLQIDRSLQINGPVQVGSANVYNRGYMNIFNTQLTLHLTDWNVGYANTGSGSTGGRLTLDSGTVVNGADVGQLSIGRETGASNYSGIAANGSLTLASNSELHLGTAASPATLNIGWSQNGNTYGGASGNATGVLDALSKAAVLDLNLSEVNVGRGNYNGFGTGTLKWNQTEVITAPNVYFGRGYATGNLVVPAGGEIHLGTDAARITNLRIAYNDAGGNTATANLDFSQTNPIFTAYISGDLSIGRETGASNYSGIAANGSLTLASNSELHLGTAASPATLNIGWSQNGNTYGGASGNATGVLDALSKAAVLDLNLSELNVGRGNYNGFGTGTLKWNQTEVITAPNVYFGRGYATGNLVVPAGGEIHLGTDAARITNLRIAYNDAGGNTATANLDFSQTNPIFTAYISGDLSIGRETGASNYSGIAANGSLTLASNSELHLGTAASPATLNIGWSQNGNTYGGASGNATGVLDALSKAAVLDLNLSELNVGRGNYNGFGTGTLKWNQTEVITAPNVYLGRGYATGNLVVPAGGEIHLGTDAARITNLRIAYNDAGGNTATANLDFSQTNPIFTAYISGDLSIGRETGASNYSGIAANGSLTLASNSELHLGTAASPATLNIGWSQNGNTYGGASGNATGVLDALSKAAVLDLQLSELDVGRGNYNGFGTGTLKWNQTEVITAPNVYFGRGYATGNLVVPAGGEIHLGTDAARITNLRIAYNDAGGNTATANLDFSQTNPIFTAYISGDLSIGRETGASNYSGIAANGSLTLASNSELHLGTAASPATLNIGWSQNGNTYGGASGNATGVLDALSKAAVLDLQLSELDVGRGNYNGFGTGTLKWNQTEVITAPNVYFGRGYATGNLVVPAGGEIHLGTDAARITNLRIAYNDAGGNTATANLDFSQTNPIFTAYISGDLSIGRETGASNYSGIAANGSLTLASNSELHLGTAASPATLNIGWSQNGNTYGGASGNATGVLDALSKAAVLDLNLSELNVGRGNYNGFGTGTLKWNQTEVITAPNVYFGRGYATGNLVVPAGGEIHLGTDAARITNLRIAYNDAGGNTATANLDFSQTNPIFTAYISGDLSIGRETGASNYSGIAANGSLTLASNSELHLGTAASPATLNIGWSQNANGYGGASGNATGVFDATNGTLTADLSTLTIGKASVGSASGSFMAGDHSVVNATTVSIGSGPATGFLDIAGATLHATTLNLASGTFEFNDGTLTIGTNNGSYAATLNLSGGLLTGDTLAVTSGQFNDTGGILDVNTVNGALNQSGGTLAVGIPVGQTTINGNYNLASASKLSIDIFGNTFDASTQQYDRLQVNGTVKLNSDSNPAGGGTLDVHLGYEPTVGSQFLVVSNDGSDAISGRFKGLLEGASFNVAYGSETVTFQISYYGGDGNDVTLTVTGTSGTAPTGLTVTGTSGAELLTGSVGNDTITGLGGNDVLTGGPGADVFAFAPGFGSDRITDFTPGSDHIQLSTALGIANFAALDTNADGVLDTGDAHISIAGGDTIITLGSHQIDVVGVTHLVASDFLFVP